MKYACHRQSASVNQDPHAKQSHNQPPNQRRSNPSTASHLAAQLRDLRALEAGKRGKAAHSKLDHVVHVKVKQAPEHQVVGALLGVGADGKQGAVGLLSLVLDPGHGLGLKGVDVILPGQAQRVLLHMVGMALKLAMPTPRPTKERAGALCSQ